MALKNLFDMVKADRYTADGREEIIKAQEAETEDKVYQIGEISQKTGLQKTANGWVKPKNGKQPGAKKEEPKNVHGAEVDKIYERQLKRIKELKAKGFTDEQIDNDKIIKQTKEDMKNVGKKPESKPAEKHPPMVMPKGMSPAEFMKAWEDSAKKNGFKKGQGNEWREHLRKEEAESKPAAPRREAVSAGRMMKDLDGNFWSRPEDFKEDITSRGWDVDEMTNEYAVISNEAGSQYEVRFDDHSDDGDLTVRNFKALQIDEDDDDDSLEDSAPSLSEIVDRVYNIGEISEKTGLQKTAQGWRPPQETKFGKVKQNKEGQWGVQVKQGKGSDFLKHKSEAEAKRALSNYTAGYNTTARSKEDPHSDKARQVKQWRKEDDKAAKARRAEGRAAHAAQFQKPTAGNNLPDIPDFKGMESSDYDNKLRAEGWTTGGWEGNGTHASAIFKKGDRTIRVNEGQPGKITSVQEISKPAAQEAQNKQKDEIWKDMKKREGALRAKGMTSRHFMDDPEYAHLSELYKNEMENDAAPRILTGDTKIRVRKA